MQLEIGICTSCGLMFGRSLWMLTDRAAAPECQDSIETSGWSDSPPINVGRCVAWILMLAVHEFEQVVYLSLMAVNGEPLLTGMTLYRWCYDGDIVLHLFKLNSPSTYRLGSIPIPSASPLGPHPAAAPPIFSPVEAPPSLHIPLPKLRPEL